MFPFLASVPSGEPLDALLAPLVDVPEAACGSLPAGAASGGAVCACSGLGRRCTVMKPSLRADPLLAIHGDAQTLLSTLGR